MNTVKISPVLIAKEGDRYKINLPAKMNFLWKELNEKKVLLNIIIEIPDFEAQKLRLKSRAEVMVIEKT